MFHALRVSLLVALAVAVGACGDGTDSRTGHHSSGAADALPLPKRLAFMTGHVEAGLALYRAGEPQMAARHLLHPVSETHAAERDGLAELGFDAELFVAVSDALEQGIPAETIEPQLAAAEANLAAVARRAGGEPTGIIDYLLDTVVDEYAVGVRSGAISDPGEYQDAYGFAIVAHDRAGALAAPRSGDVRAALDELIALWSGPPVPVDQPASVADVRRAVTRVRDALHR